MASSPVLLAQSQQMTASEGLLVIVVEDHAPTARLLECLLVANGFRTLCLDNAGEALVAIRQKHPSLVVLDLGLPDLDGASVCAHLRDWYDEPIMVISGRSEESTVVSLFERGADDYVCKPFRPSELMARVRSLLQRRRSVASQRRMVQIEDIRIDLDLRQVRVGDAEIHLTQTEFDLLACLGRNVNRVVSLEELQTSLWGPHHGDYAQACRVHVVNLRKKLRALTEGCLVRTAPGVGYYIEHSPAT